MRPPEHTKEDVISAGHELIKQGKAVTGFGLRGLLGGGNAQRLKTIWEEHQAGDLQQASPALEFPPELEAVVKAAADRVGSLFFASAQDIYVQANKAADKRVSDAVAAAHEQAASAARELAEAGALVDRLQQTIDEQAEQINAQKAEIQAVNQAAQAQALELAAVTEREKSLNLQLGQAQTAQASLMTEIKELQKALASEVANASGFSSEIQLLKQQIGQVNATHATEKAALEQQIQQLAKDLGLKAGESKKALEELATLGIKLGEKEGMLIALQEQNEKLIEKIGTNKESNIKTSKETKETVKETPSGIKKPPVKKVVTPLKAAGK